MERAIKLVGGMTDVEASGSFKLRKLSNEADITRNGGSGGGGGMDTDLIDAKLAATKSEMRENVADLRTELVRIESYIEISSKDIQAKLLNLPSKFNLWAVAGTTIAVFIAIVTLAGDRFDGGYAASSAYALQLEQARAQTTKQIAETDAKVTQAISQSNARFDQLESLIIKVAQTSDEKTKAAPKKQ